MVPKSLALFALVLSTFALQAQPPLQPDTAQRAWTAAWITHPTAPLREPLVLHFRRNLNLSSAPASYRVRVSADNRFILFVNGHRVGDGPARGDLTHWRYERFDLAPFLHSGQNLITATVWNFGIFAPIAQMSDRTAFLLESEATGANSSSTPDGWLVEEEHGHHPLDRSSVTSRRTWRPVRAKRSTPRSTTGTGTPRMPPAQHGFPPRLPCATASTPVSTKRTRPTSPATIHGASFPTPSAHGILATPAPAKLVRTRSSQASISEAVPTAPPSHDVPAGSHVHLLLDRKTLTTAYPQLTVSGGKGAHIRLTYCRSSLRQEPAQRATATTLTTASPRPYRQLPSRRRRASHLRAALVAHLALSRPRHHYRRRSAHARLTHRAIHRLSV